MIVLPFIVWLFSAKYEQLFNVHFLNNMFEVDLMYFKLLV